MSTRFGLLFALVATLLPAAEWRPLFNGRDLTGWTTWLARPAPTSDVPGLPRDAEGRYLEPLGADRDPLRVFTVVDHEGRPALRFSGEVFGTLITRESFKNYRLRLQYKWGTRKWPPRETVVRDSGLLYHVHGEGGAHDATWPRSVELQIQEGDTGDLWTIGTRIRVRARPKQGDQFAVYDPSREPLLIADWNSPNSSRCIKLATHERPGEWNTVELICLGDQSIHVVNGHVVMRLHQPERPAGGGWGALTEGAIALQSEGAEVYFRDIELQPIASLPDEYAE